MDVRKSPPGCVIGVLAVLPGIVSVTGVCGLIRWYHLPPEMRHFDQLFYKLAAVTVIGSLVTILVCFIAIRVHRATDYEDYNRRD
ncbi:MAG: hypothetical protein ABIT37_16115 [Luteolibacter sp.]